MKTIEERRILLHERAKQLERHRARAALTRYAVSAICLLLSLITAVSYYSGFNRVICADGFYGSSLLDENAGGYVLTAVISFVAAVTITVILIRRKDIKKKSYLSNDTYEKRKEMRSQNEE